MTITRLFSVQEPVTPSVELPKSGYVRFPAVKAYTGLSKTTWYDGMKAGIYPKQIKVGRRAVGWDVEDLRRWKESCKVAS